MGTRSNPQCLLRWRTTDTATRTATDTATRTAALLPGTAMDTRTLATRTRHTVGTAMATPMPLPMLPPTLLRHTPVIMATATPTAPPMPGIRTGRHTAMGMATATPTAAMDMATATPTAAMEHTDMGTRTTR